LGIARFLDSADILCASHDNLPLDFNNLDSISNSGFVGFKSKAELFADSSIIPKVRGVYLILYTNAHEPAFLSVGCGGFFKGKDPNASLAELKSNWVSNSLVVYVGKAGGSGSSATLHSRLKQYLAFGQGKKVGHYGGRYIWQLQNPKELIVCWKPLKVDEPREIERQLIADFSRQFGKKPFANLAG
jgi:hypothetical protein